MVKYIENYALQEEIGAGVYAKVYRALNSQDKKEYAVKVIPVQKFKDNKKLEECTVNQINILTNIETHAYIIKYYDMLKTTNNFYFIYEYCNGGTLDQRLQKKRDVGLGERESLLIFSQLLQAFQTLNKYNIMHRDLKPDNIFFHENTIKLGDFGFCKNLASPDEMAKTMLGSPIYMAPEVLKGQIYSNKSDIWSLGVVLYEMLFGKCPFTSHSIAQLIEVLNTTDLNIPDTISPFLKVLITRMLTKDPLRRIGWMELFAIKINDNGQIESEKITQQISSLSDAKTLANDSKLSGNSSTDLRKVKENNPTSAVEPLREVPNFKKNRSTNEQTNSQYYSYQNLNENYSNGSSTAIHGNYSIAKTMSKDKGNENAYVSREKAMIEEHLTILQGVKIAADLVEAKIPNAQNFGYLILARCEKNLNDFLARLGKSQANSFIMNELQLIKQEKEMIYGRMFQFEAKGIEDWKKYLRGKFTEDEKQAGHWYRMLCYLSGQPASELSNKGMQEQVKSILY